MSKVQNLDLAMPIYILIENSSNYSETRGSLWFYLKDEANNCDADTANVNNFNCFEYKTKLLGNKVANGANGILINPTIAAPLKYLSTFCRSLEMPLINCKIELKLKWTKYCVLSAAGADNTDANLNNFIFTIKDTKDNQKLSKLFSKGFEKSVYWNEYKIKSENQNTTNEYRDFREANFLGVNRFFILVYSNQYNKAKRLKN